MVSSPEDYLYSSYYVNALDLDGLIESPHSLFTQLSQNKAKQHEFYRLLFGEAISQDDLNEIRLGCSYGTPIGWSRFKKTIESVVGRKIGHLSKGRPFSDSD